MGATLQSAQETILFQKIFGTKTLCNTNNTTKMPQLPQLPNALLLVGMNPRLTLEYRRQPRGIPPVPCTTHEATQHQHRTAQHATQLPAPEHPLFRAATCGFQMCAQRATPLHPNTMPLKL